MKSTLFLSELLFDFKKSLGILLLFFLVPLISVAQQSAPEATKDTGKALIHVLNNDYGEFIRKDGRSVQKLVNNVKLRYASDTLFCDSAFFYVDENSVEAFGQVAIFQADGTRAYAEYMRYNGANRKVYMRDRHNDVLLQDRDNNALWSKEITYQLDKKVGTYDKGGVLESNGTIVSSQKGTYYLKTHEARFSGNVIVNNPDYEVHSEDLGYNTNSEVVTFHGPSVVFNEQSVMKVRSGFYNSKDSISHFDKRAAIWHNQQFVEGDVLDYNQRTGLAKAKGEVIVIDRTQGMNLFSGVAIYNEQTEELWAYDRPLALMLQKKDSFFLKADTFYSAPLPDSLGQLKSGNKQLEETVDELKQQIFDPNAVVADSLAETSKDSLSLTPEKFVSREGDRYDMPTPPANKTSDTLSSPQAWSSNSSESKPRFFIAYYKVELFSDSLQGIADSLYYSEYDSLLRLHTKPFLWPGKGNQVAGKIILLKMDSSELRQLIVPEEGILINQIGPKAAGFYNQVQGDVINGYFENNQMSRLVAAPHAQSIYYVVNEEDEYVGCSEASGREIEMVFDTSTNKVDKIFYRQGVEQKMIPMKEVQPSQMRLSRFLWAEEQRPKSLKIFLEGVSKMRKPEWE